MGECRFQNNNIHITEERKKMGYVEGFLEYPGGLKIRYRLAKNPGHMPVVLVHDMGERLEMYEYLFPRFSASGFTLNAIELRGHGQSDGQYGHIDDFKWYCRDLKRLVTGHLQGTAPVLLGCGAGGLIAARVAQDERIQLSGLVLVSPMLKLQMKPATRLLVQAGGVLLPGMRIRLNREGPGVLTGEDVFRAMLRDEEKRTAQGVTLSFLKAYFREQKKFRRNAGVLKRMPVLLMLAGRDSMVDTVNVEEMMSVMMKGHDEFTLEQYNEGLHSLLFDEKRDEYVSDIISWLKKIDPVKNVKK